MLARNNSGASVNPGVEKEICSWTADDTSYLIGFTGTGSYSAEYRLYIGTDPDPWWVYQTSPGNRTAYIADRGVKLPAGEKVSLKVIHDDSDVQTFKGTILGGA